MSVHGGIIVEDIPRGLSDEVIQQYFFSKGSEIQLFQFDEDARKARIIFENNGVVAEILSSSHRIGRHVIKVTRMDESEIKAEHGSSTVSECSSTTSKGETSEQCGTETPTDSDTSTSTVTMSVDFEFNQWKVVSNSNSNEVEKIKIQAREHGVSITYPTHESSTVVIVGALPHVMRARQCFEDLKQQVIVSSKTLHYSPGLWTVLKSMNDSISLLEHQAGVSINLKAVPSSYSDTDSGPSRVIFLAQINRCNIEICSGNFVHHPSATTMINLVVENFDQHHLPELIETGGKEIFSDVKSRVKELSSCALPQVFETKPRNLSVQKLIHCVVLKWSPNDKRTATILEEGLKGAMIGSTPPCVVINQLAPVQCPPLILVDIITKTIETNSQTFSGFTFAVYVVAKEEVRTIEHFFQDKSIPFKSNDHYGLLEQSKGDKILSDMYIQVLEGDLFSFLSITHGNLLEQKVEVYVNSTNSDLDLSRGALSKQLLKLMGQKLQDECNEYASLAVGKVAVTSAEKMFCKVILHVNLPSYNVKGSQRVFREAVQNVLQICFDQSLTSIAIPSLGTGQLGYPHHLVADVVISEVLGFNEKHPNFLKKVVFVLAERDTYEKCIKVYAEKLLTSTSEKVLTVDKTTTNDKDSAMLYVQCCGIEDIFLDIIVNPIGTGSNSNPLVQVLSKKAGEALQTLCSQLVENSIILDVKKSLFTKPSGKLRCKKILHVYNPNSNEYSSDTLCTVALNALCLAEQEQYRALCFPLFGSGYPLQEKTSKIIQACLDFGQKSPAYLKKIVLVTAEECDYDGVCSCLSNVKARSQIYMDSTPVNTMNLQHPSWRQTKRRSLHPWDMKDFKMLENKDAVIDVYCCVAQQGNSVIQDIESELEKRLVTDYIEDGHIHYLIASEVNDIKSYTGQLGVAIALSKQRNKMTLSGERTGVEVAKTYITNILASLKHTKTLLDQVVWQRVTNSGVETIHEEISFQLESGRTKDIQLMNVNWGVYSSVIDLKNMLEIDLSSGKTCSIRRMDKPKFDPTLLLLKALHDLIEDPLFSTRSPSPAQTRENAIALVSFCNESLLKPSVRGSGHGPSLSLVSPVPLPLLIRSTLTELTAGLMTSEHAVPKYWQPIPLENGEEKSCHLFTVPSGTEEYEIAVKEFRETMYGKKFTIVKLERIQNFNEYSKQCAFLDVLKRKYSGDVLMKRLFHGTSSLSVEAIAHQGFNRIFAADANAAVFGKGVYFAGRANYSAQEKYSVPDEHGYQKMFICRVVVGKYAKGEKTMKVAPPLDPSRNKHLLFDTLVDNVSNPTIYVVMSDSQAYPEYVVTFRTH